jgi:drug/metabolite transporter (DMT)-like permease
MPLGEAAALLNAVAWAATGVTAKSLSKAVRPFHVITAHTLVATAAFLLVMSATGELSRIGQTPAGSLALFSAAALINALGSYIFFTAVSTGSVGGTYTTTTGLYVLLSLIAGAVFLDERIAPLAFAGAAAIVAGVYILNGPGSNRLAARPGQPAEIRGTAVASSRVRTSRVFTGVGLGVITAVLWTVGLLVLKWGLDDSDALTAGFMRNLVAAIVYVAAGLAVARKGMLVRAGRRDWTWLIAGALLFTASTYLWNYALEHTDAGKTAVLASTAPVFALIMAIVVLRERMTLVAVAGAAVALTGTLLVVVAR